jgi:uncharacterized membrane protein
VSRTHGAIIGAAFAIIGFVVAGYLAVVKLAGELPVCGPLRGCETVALSEYSEIAGIPVALVGAGFSAVQLALHLLWWRLGDRRALLGAYGLGLFGMVFVAYLTYLELFVIGAVCVWCVVYAVTIVAGWLVIAVTLRRTRAGPP